MLFANTVTVLKYNTTTTPMIHHLTNIHPTTMSSGMSSFQLIITLMLAGNTVMNSR